MNVFRTNIHFGFCTTSPEYVSECSSTDTARGMNRGNGGWWMVERTTDGRSEFFYCGLLLLATSICHCNCHPLRLVCTF